MIHKSCFSGALVFVLVQHHIRVQCVSVLMIPKGSDPFVSVRRGAELLRGGWGWGWDELRLEDLLTYFRTHP